MTRLRKESLPLGQNDIQAHGKDERVGISSYYDGVEFYYRYLKTLTSPNGEPALRGLPVTALIGMGWLIVPEWPVIPKFLLVASMGVDSFWMRRGSGFSASPSVGSANTVRMIASFFARITQRPYTPCLFKKLKPSLG